MRRERGGLRGRRTQRVPLRACPTLFALRTRFSSVLALLVMAGPGYSTEPGARVHPIRLPVFEGKDIRFTQLHSEEGLLEGEVTILLRTTGDSYGLALRTA